MDSIDTTYSKLDEGKSPLIATVEHDESPYMSYAKNNPNMMYGIGAFIVFIIILIIVLSTTSKSAFSGGKEHYHNRGY